MAAALVTARLGSRLRTIQEVVDEG